MQRMSTLKILEGVSNVGDYQEIFEISRKWKIGWYQWFWYVSCLRVGQSCGLKDTTLIFSLHSFVFDKDESNKQGVRD